MGEFSDPCKAKCDTKFVDSFPYNKVANKVRKAINNTACTECKVLFGNTHNIMDRQVEQEHIILYIYISDNVCTKIDVLHNLINIREGNIICDGFTREEINFMIYDICVH